MEKLTPNMSLVTDLKQYIESMILKKGHSLPNTFFEKNGYESDMCKWIESSASTTDGDKRYWDGTVTLSRRDGTSRLCRMEFKKSKACAFWCDEIRYAEHLLARKGLVEGLRYPKEAAKTTVTLFIQTKTEYDIPYVTKIHILSTLTFLDFFEHTKEQAVAMVTRDSSLQAREVDWNSQLSSKVHHLLDLHALTIDVVKLIGLPEVDQAAKERYAEKLADNRKKEAAKRETKLPVCRGVVLEQLNEMKDEGEKLLFKMEELAARCSAHNVPKYMVAYVLKRLVVEGIVKKPRGGLHEYLEQ